jgi:hypothetical protein
LAKGRRKTSDLFSGEFCTVAIRKLENFGFKKIYGEMLK